MLSNNPYEYAQLPQGAFRRLNHVNSSLGAIVLEESGSLWFNVGHYEWTQLYMNSKKYTILYFYFNVKRKQTDFERNL